MPQPSLLKSNWKKDHVYLVSFPRTGAIPQCSPFGLKLETWLRVCDIPYSNLSNNFTRRSAKGQIPFIELNGEEVADSNFIIERLKQEFKKDPDAKLTPSERGQYTSYMALLENLLFWCMMYHRSHDNKWVGTDKGFVNHLSGIKKLMFQKVMLERMRKNFVAACHVQGIGRHNQLEVDKIIKDGLQSLEQLIVNKPFFFGSSPTTLDCAAFGLISQFQCTPMLSSAVKDYLTQKCPNLADMVNRIREEFWPDWNEACEKLSLDTEWRKK